MTTPADKVIDFVQQFCCTKSGQKLRLLPWQLDVIRKLYGTLNADGLRQYRQAFIFLPRRNGKSTFLAALLIYHLVCEEDAGEIYVLSNTITQSNDAIFDACLSIIQHSPALQKRLKIIKSRGRIVNRKNRSRLAVLSSTHAGLMGKDASVLCFDEISFFRDRRLYSNLKGSQLNRRQPLNISITTASDNLEGVGKELYDYAKRVATGVLEDPTFLPVLFEAGPDLDWQNPETWKAANPSLGTLFAEDDLAKLAREAAAEPRKRSEFFQFHLNRWQHSSIAWIAKEVWDACRDNFTENDLLGKPCHTGIDLARRHDMAAVVHVFPRGDEYLFLPRFFLPKVGIEQKEIQDSAPYRVWAEQGHLTLTDGDVIDYGAIRDRIKSDAELFQIQELAYDPWSGELLCNQLLRQEDGINCVEVRQRIDLIAPACMQFERLLRDKKIRHNDNPILNWHANNVSVRADANGNVMPNKKHAKSRFDGITAAILGLSRCVADPQGPCLITLDD